MAGTPACTIDCNSTVPVIGAANAPVQFEATATPSAGCTGSPSYAWIFGDGGTSSAQNPTHTYATAGNYGWSLTVTLSGAQSCTTSGTIDVTLASLIGDHAPGVYLPSSGIWFLRDSNSAGPAGFAFGYGPAGADWTPIAGDWNVAGVDAIGLYSPATPTFFLRNANAAGPADVAFG